MTTRFEVVRCSHCSEETYSEVSTCPHCGQIMPDVTPHKANAEKKSSSYFARHWRGELSLPVSFWINAILISLVLTAALVFVNGYLVSTQKFHVLYFLSFFLLFFGPASSIWMSVGVWRSSGNFRKINGNRLWSVLARTCAVLGIISTAFGMHAKVKVIKGVSLLAFRGHYEIALLPGGTELALRGSITPGVAEAVRSQLDRNPGITTLRLNSTGGLLDEARAIRDLVQERKLATHSSRGCYSACTLPFLAGSQRTLKQGARLGFHKASGVFGNRIDADKLQAVDRKYLASKGVPPWFIEKAYSTPHSRMWKPKPAELIKASYVDRISS